MVRKVGLICSLATAAGLGLATPSTAFAATTLGQTFTPNADSSCAGVPPEREFVQTGRASGVSYAAPSAGVLTSWSFQAGDSQTTVLTLRVFHPTGTAHQYTVVADGGLLQVVPASSGLQTLPTRIAVQAGDLVGIHSTSGSCASFGSALDTYDFKNGSTTPIGGTGSYTPSNSFTFDIAARLEPDADHDGYGDETQDQCPTDPSTQGACPLTGPLATGQRAAALKKCKKKHSKKARKKCKKKANLLPV